MAIGVPEIVYEPFSVRERRISESYLDIKLPVVLSAIACQIMGMSILRTLTTCGFTACLFTACVLRLTSKNPQGFQLNSYLKNTKILMFLAIAMILEPPLYYFGFYMGYVIYLLPRILLVETLLKLPKDCIPRSILEEASLEVFLPPPSYAEIASL